MDGVWLWRFFLMMDRFGLWCVAVLTYPCSMFIYTSSILADLDRVNFNTSREGGIHGIGAGTYAAGGMGIGDGDGGNFANLCERRLAFELSQLPRPDDSILTLINRYEHGCVLLSMVVVCMVVYVVYGYGVYESGVPTI